MGSIQRNITSPMGLNYNGTDFVARINGSTSDLVSRPEWGQGCYGAKIEGAFTRYCLASPTGGWEVTDKSGTKYYYGSSANSRLESTSGVFKWALDRVQDVNGNTMTVTISPLNKTRFLGTSAARGRKLSSPHKRAIGDLEVGKRAL